MDHVPLYDSSQLSFFSVLCWRLAALLMIDWKGIKSIDSNPESALACFSFFCIIVFFSILWLFTLYCNCVRARVSYECPLIRAASAFLEYSRNVTHHDLGHTSKENWKCHCFACQGRRKIWKEEVKSICSISWNALNSEKINT